MRTADCSFTGVDSAVWLFWTQKTAGSFLTPHALIASCHSPSEEPPSPISEIATRSDPSRANAMATPAMFTALTPSGAVGGRMPQPKSAT